MKTKLKFTTIPLSIAQTIVLLAVALWFWSGHKAETSPTVQDAVHQIPYNDHGTTRYLTTELVRAKSVALSVGFMFLGFTIANVLYIARRTHRPINEMFRHIRLFRSIEIEINKKT
jgi:hypothetical protein